MENYRYSKEELSSMTLQELDEHYEFLEEIKADEKYMLEVEVVINDLLDIID